MLNWEPLQRAWSWVVGNPRGSWEAEEGDREMRCSTNSLGNEMLVGERAHGEAGVGKTLFSYPNGLLSTKPKRRILD